MLECCMTLLTENLIPEFKGNSFQTMEEYSTAITNLNSQGYQLSKGDFNGKSEILLTDAFQLGLQTAEATHLQIGQADKNHIT